MPNNRSIAVFGTLGTGRSTLVNQFVNQKFLEDANSTITRFFKKEFIIDEKNYTLDIVDTVEDIEFHESQDLNLNFKGVGFVLVYSVTDRESFQMITTLKNQIMKIKSLKKNHRNEVQAPIVLVGNKCDLEKERQVSIEEGKELAIVLGIPFLETSAKALINVDETFETIVREMSLYIKKDPDQSKIDFKKKNVNSCIIS